LVIDKKLYGENHPIIAVRYNNLVLIYSGKQEYDKAIQYSEKALKIYRNAYGEDHPEIAISYSNLALIYSDTGNYDKAIEYLQISLEMGRKYYGEDHPKMANRYNNLAVVHYLKGDYNSAANCYEKAYNIILKFDDTNTKDIETIKANYLAAKERMKNNP